MANWCGHARTNYFRVKDKEAFERWAESIGDLEVVDDAEGRVGLLSNHEHGGWPLCKCDPEKGDEDEDFDLFQDVASHLADGSVAVFEEVGAEKLRYLTGVAVAINSEGESVRVALTDIYRLAESLGKEVTGAEY
ncbi:MAG TPA: hypothetical protein VHC22_32395 [Pirellulales bacterium]|nr:hypothetical protein [Pirellulales bacterium]